LESSLLAVSTNLETVLIGFEGTSLDTFDFSNRDLFGVLALAEKEVLMITWDESCVNEELHGGQVGDTGVSATNSGHKSTKRIGKRRKLPGYQH